MLDNYLLTNGNIITMDSRDSRAEAMAVENGRILRIGANSDMADLAEAGWPVTDLQGQTVLPGFIDSHQHLGLTGQVLNGIDFQGTKGLKTVFDKVREAAGTAAPDAWVLGYTLNDFSLKEKRMPLKEELDAVCADKPVMIVHSSWHMCALNSLALEILSPPADLPGMDLKPNGDPTGVVRDPGAPDFIFPAVSSRTPDEVKLTSFRKACEAALKQ
ncbi:MAG TPA: amidohydrolase family protein, partial [Pseudodesulfovibrio sp.]|nr:amidohydrolase family protein [Pseudodesulfovibrio sp.]